MLGGLFGFLKRRRREQRPPRFIPALDFSSAESKINEGPVCSSDRTSSGTGVAAFNELYSSSPELSSYKSQPEALFPMFKDVSTSQSESFDQRNDRLTPFERISKISLNQTSIDNIQKLVRDHEIRIIKPIHIKHSIYMGVMRGMNVAVKKQAFKRANHAFKHWSTREANIQRMASEKAIFDRDRGFPHIVAFVDHFKFETLNTHILVMEYCEFGTLLSFIQHVPELGVGIPIIFQFALDFAVGVDFLHRINIAHRDIKLENALLTSDRSMERVVLKIADFGYSTMVTDQTYYPDQPGSLDYAAPESYFHTGLICPMEVDFWAFGVCLFGMFEGRFPFNLSCTKEDPLMERLHNFALLRDGRFHFPYSNMTTNLLFRNLVEKLMAYDSSERFSLNQVLRSPFFNSIVPTATTPRQMTKYMAIMGDSCSE